MNETNPEAQPATSWQVIVDPAFLKEEDLPPTVRSTGIYFKPITFLLINRGEVAARDVEIVVTDRKQKFGDTLAWDVIEPATAKRFVATRRLVTDNSFRLQWFQEDLTARYWQTLYLANI